MATFPSCSAMPASSALSGHLRRGEGRAVHGAAVLGKGQPHGEHLRRGKNKHVVRPQGAGVGRCGGVAVVVAGGDDHMAPELCQRGGQLLRRLAVDAVAVEQVARQQHQLYAVIIGVLHHAAGQIAALLPPLPGPAAHSGR